MDKQQMMKAYFFSAIERKTSRVMWRVPASGNNQWDINKVVFKPLPANYTPAFSFIGAMKAIILFSRKG